MKMFIFLLVVTILAAVNGRPPTTPTESPQCGYASCHPVKEGFINVHIVPHTHDDVGWLKTVDQYFYGANSTIQKAGVQYILDSVIDALRKDVNRRFIYVETAFFWKWWIKQHDVIKQLVRRFVNNGQLEFIGGAWSMNDEAATHYQSTIDQFTWGLRKLNDTFGECGRPKIGWQIDPFGHSKEMASIFAQLGFDGVLLGRIDYQDKELRMKSKTAEMIWRGSESLGEKSDIFTGVMYNVYGPPPGFCFDVLCDDEPIVDDTKSPIYNIDRKVDDFFAYIKNVSDCYATSNVIITMGEDFHYQDANMWFKNLDKLIYNANKRQQSGSKYNLLYSTPSCYIKAVNDESKNKKWLVKEDDFFPYASDPHAYWTGYFTSRPTSKRFEREGNNYLQVCKQLYALADLGPEDRVDLNVMREAMGVMQHHDAITGTEKEHVAHDYARILDHGFKECEFITASALSAIVTNNKSKEAEPEPEIPFISCSTNTSSCSFTETQNNFVVTVYNPLSRPVSKHVRLPVLGEAYSVKDSKGTSLTVQLVPIADAILKLPGRISSAKVELIFLANEIPPLGFKSYYVEKVNGNNVGNPEFTEESNFEDVTFKISGDTGLLTQISMNGKSIPINQDFYYYTGFVGDNKIFENRSSGAYIFRPNSTQAYKVSEKANIKIYRGTLVAEVQQTFNDWISQIIRIYNTENFIEFDWIIGPIPTNDNYGKEVISRFTTELNTNDTFYTDSNGREMLKRIKNFRPSYSWDVTEPISGNYYPITSKIVVIDEEQDIEVAVLTDRAQGGSSLLSGELELMIHRRCLHDDSFGVGEALMEEEFNEGLAARGSHYVIVGSYKNQTGSKSTAAQERDLAQRKLLSAWTFLSPTNGLTFEEYKAKYLTEYSGLKKILPDNVQILTFEPWKGFSFLLRLEHVLAKNEDAELSKPVTVDLQGLFTAFEIETLEETTLAGNQWLKENDRLKFNTGDSIEDLDSSLYNLEHKKSFDESKYSQLKTIWNRNKSRNNLFKRATTINVTEDIDLKITLTPMQIRTFIINIKKH